MQTTYQPIFDQWQPGLVKGYRRMEPTWQTADGSVRLYLGDCRDVLATIATGSCDITMTSPPYNIKGGEHTGSGMFSDDRTGSRKMISGDWYDDAMPEDAYWDWLNGIISECRRVSRGLVWMNHKVRFVDCEALHPAKLIDQPVYSEVIWDRGGSITLNARKFAPSHEALWAFGKPHYWANECNTMLSVWRITPKTSADHPCPYPFELARRPIVASCPVGGIVLDPFSGSATTGVAAVRLGRSYVGIEKERRFFDLGVREIEAELNRAPLFEPPPQIQRAMFTEDA